jgi:transposase InsO family protein
MRVHGVPDQILTDNGKVFTARFGKGPGPVLFDRICNDNGIRHLLTAAYSPTTTGKVEGFHKTLRREWLNENDYRCATIAEVQASLDAWSTSTTPSARTSRSAWRHPANGSVWPPDATASRSATSRLSRRCRR